MLSLCWEYWRGSGCMFGLVNGFLYMWQFSVDPVAREYYLADFYHLNLFVSVRQN